MKEDYTIYDNKILNKFKIPVTASTNSLDEFYKIGWLNDVFLDKSTGVFVAIFKGLYAN